MSVYKVTGLYSSVLHIVILVTVYYRGMRKLLYAGVPMTQLTDRQYDCFNTHATSLYFVMLLVRYKLQGHFYFQVNNL